MTGVESPGNCAIPPRIRPLWSQGHWNPAPFFATIGNAPAIGHNESLLGNYLSAGWTGASVPACRAVNCAKGTPSARLLNTLATNKPARHP